MKSNIKTLAVLSALALATSVQASNVTATTSSDSSWIGAPSFSTGSTPITGNGGTTTDNDNWGQAGSGYGANGSLAETFYLSTGGTLQNIQMVLDGNSVTFDVMLYDLGPVSSVYGASFPTVIPTQSNFVPTTSSVGQVDMLQPGDSFSYSSSPSTLVTLTFSGNDANVQLLANEVYALCLDPTASASSTWWLRGTYIVPSEPSYYTAEGWNTDSSGYAYAYQDFEGKGSTSSNVRDFDTAVTVRAVPEPCSLALLGGALMAFGVIRRRK